MALRKRMEQFYSQRLVNPFRGILSVVETEDADAVSSDGVHWALYIHGETEDVRMSDGTLRDVVLPDIKFGDWSREDGLKRSPVRNVADLDRLDAIGSHLLEAVKAATDRLPFPLRDQDELWLLDAEDRPLALLNVAVHESERETPRSLFWRTGEAAKARFVSTQALVSDHPERCACEVLEELVNNACGPDRRAQWFWRSSDGTGVGQDGVNLHPDLIGRTLASGEFPRFLLGMDWATAAEQALIREFLDWQAPWLLQLQHLSREDRDYLEQCATRRAREVAKCHRLYPELIDADRITAARVEAKLRGGADEAGKEDQSEYSVDVTLIPFYRE